MKKKNRGSMSTFQQKILEERIKKGGNLIFISGQQGSGMSFSLSYMLFGKYYEIKKQGGK